jgi:hypothetical protein
MENPGRLLDPPARTGVAGFLDDGALGLVKTDECRRQLSGEGVQR